MNTTKILGDEFDEALKKRLTTTLKSMGAQFSEPANGVAGSQEISTLLVTLGEQQIVIEAETYVGLSISGDPLIVEKIIQQLGHS